MGHCIGKMTVLWHNERSEEKRSSRASPFSFPLSPIRSFVLDICTKGYVPWILGTHLSFFLFLLSSFSFYHLLISSSSYLSCQTFSLFFFRNGGYLDCRWGNTSIIFRFPFSRISRYRYSIIGAGWSVFLLLERGERWRCFVGLHWHWGLDRHRVDGRWRRRRRSTYAVLCIIV